LSGKAVSPRVNWRADNGRERRIDKKLAAHYYEDSLLTRIERARVRYEKQFAPRQGMT
jgi:hypothetical protein